MSVDAKEQRARMLRSLAVIEHYERHSAIGARLMRGTRYELAVQATDVNGDRCLFPACGCAKADCARQPLCIPQISWGGPKAGWRTR
ncbi:hypothetical protein [Azospirillum soli]|uniref:hypothetical protein n=1 Tax=Azospirillum soli TaxID=1304799 RepID=UPI001AE80185|nr:hypothetical protein [Azospirillum soli]MBP2314631.1 hypothetical protein [Azospirillum soli]